MIVLPLVFLGMLYVIARFGFIFPAVAVEENYSLRLAWQHSAGQGGRMVGALFAAGFPIAVAQILLTFLLSNALLGVRSEEHTSELQSLMRISYAVFCSKKKKQVQPRHIKNI